MRKILKKINILLLTVSFVLTASFSPVPVVFASGEWPVMGAELTAESAIVVDADTGTVLYGKDIHAKRYPASITKLMTALVVLENCRLDETVTFTEEAVSHLESGATTAGISAGDTLSVEESLYALLLKSANEVANGLAIHVSGSIEEFAKLMNETAVRLGCLNSDFHNPSGLTDSLHVTSAYDMALIARELLKNDTFREIESHTSHKLPPTAKYPDGLTIKMGHQMMQPGTDVFDGRIIAGKTGFTSASGNTLVTCAAENDRTVVAVVLKDKNPDHYTDTAKLMDFGLRSFKNVTFDGDTLIRELKVRDRLVEEGEIDSEGPEQLALDRDVTITVPPDYDLSLLRAEYDFTNPGKITEDMEGKVLGKLKFTYSDRAEGTALLLDIHDPSLDIEALAETVEVPRVENESGGSVKKVLFITLAAILFVAAAAAVIWFIQKKKREKARRERLKRRRRERLQEMNISEGEFREMMGSSRRRRTEDTEENRQ